MNIFDYFPDFPDVLCLFLIDCYLENNSWPDWPE